MDSLTRVYTRMHDAFAAGGDLAKLSPFEVRVLVAVDDLGGSARSDLLEAAVNDQSGGSHVRRALLDLYATGHADGTGPGGGRRKRGARTIVTLTPSGAKVVAFVRAALADMALKAAA